MMYAVFMLQQSLGLRFWGGARAGAGRKRGRNVQHVRRGKQSKSLPVHVTLRASREVGNLRAQFPLVRKAIEAAKERNGARIVQFSVQGNHVHILIECESEKALGAAMKGLQGRIAKALNKRLGRKGRVFSDRYHSHRLNSPREVRNALAYILLNH